MRIQISTASPLRGASKIGGTVQIIHDKSLLWLRASIKEVIDHALVSLCAPGPLVGINRVILALVLFALNIAQGWPSSACRPW